MERTSSTQSELPALAGREGEAACSDEDAIAGRALDLAETLLTK